MYVLVDGLLRGRENQQYEGGYLVEFVCVVEVQGVGLVVGSGSTSVSRCARLCLLLACIDPVVMLYRTAYTALVHPPTNVL
jgi:hypothetical protein